MGMSRALSGSLVLAAAVTIVTARKRFSSSLRTGSLSVFILLNIIAETFLNGSLLPECDTQYIGNYIGYKNAYEIYRFTSQDDFESKLGNCTTILGDIYLETNFSGPLVMSNVINITGDIRTWYRAEIDLGDSKFGHSYNFPTNLTSVKADSLIWLGGLDLGGSPDLTVLSMPSLETIGILNIGSNSGMSIQFPQLKSCTEIEIFGGYERWATSQYAGSNVAELVSLNFDNLATVEMSLQIGGDDSNSEFEYANPGTSPWPAPGPSPPISISFPSLVNVSYLYVWGNISRLLPSCLLESLLTSTHSIHMPELATSTANLTMNAEYDEDTRFIPCVDCSGIVIWNHGNALDVNLPSLWNTTDLTLAGDLGT